MRPEVEKRQPLENSSDIEAHCVLATDNKLGVTIGFEVGLKPATNSSWFAAVVAFGDSDPVVIVEDDVTLPRASWELRASGLWADHNCETAFEHWSYGLEAFALRVESRREFLEQGFGHRVALGWEFDFEAEAAPAGEVGNYSQSGRLHGLLLLGKDRFELKANASRQHRWGARVANRAEFSSESADSVALPTPDGVWWVPV